MGVKERAEQGCREQGDHEMLTWYRQLLQAVFRIGDMKIIFSTKYPLTPSLPFTHVAIQMVLGLWF